MGKELRNDLSWSVSRDNLFQNCQRAYYYHYYGSWGGWKADAPDRIRKLYILKNIKSLVMWAGTIVHETIKQALTNFKTYHGPFPSVQELQNLAVEQLRKGWRESVSKQYLQTPNRSANLFELYYGDGKTLPREVTDALKQRLLECIENFCASPVLKDILAVDPIKWLTIDDKPETFPVNDLPVYAVIDFAYVDNHDILHIIDWKTGSERREELRLQLACYALFAMEKWGFPQEKIQLHGIFLRDGGRKQDYTLNAEMLVNAKDQILISAQSMRKLINDTENNTVEEDNCPCNPAEFRCANCNFREVCPAING